MPTVSQDVRATVEEFLADLEREYAEEHGTDLKFVLAVSRGSHAWGLAGPNSDYDVGVVYAPTDVRHYAHLGGRKESLVRDYPGDLDIDVQGWDVTKFAQLLADSNEQAIDTLRSPIVYRQQFDREPLRQYVESSYSPISLYHTYRSIAKNNYRKYLSYHLVDNDKQVYPIQSVDEDGYRVYDREADEEFRVDANDERYTETQVRQTVKRNLAVAKAAMYAKFLRVTGERGDHRLPHVDFPTFLDEQAPAVFDVDLRSTVQNLVEMKRAGDGGREVGDRIGYEFAHQSREIDPDVHAIRQPDRDRLNEFVDIMLDAV